MNIRELKSDDKDNLIELLNQLEYPNTKKFVSQKIALLLDSPNDYLSIIENEECGVIGFISIHIIPQIALEGDFARISYLTIDERYRSLGAGKLLEEYCEEIARERKCDRIEVHCHSRREKAHKFYYRQGYVESPKYLMKNL